MQKIIITFILVLQLTGCTRIIKSTGNAWSTSQPEKYHSILGDDTLPQILRDKNVTFSCKDMIYSSVGHTKKCYIEKSTAQHIDGWTERIVATVTPSDKTIDDMKMIGSYLILNSVRTIR